MKQTTLIISGKRWRLHRPARLTLDGDKCDGRCDYDTRTINVRRGVIDQLELDTLLHEMLHAAAENLDGDWVENYATDMATALWQLGYRKLTPEQLKLLGIE